MSQSMPEGSLVSLGNRRQPDFAVDVTARALDELRKLGIGGQRFLRVTTVAGGCSGTTYDAAIDDELTDTDIVLFERDEVRLVTSRSHALFLQGLQVDYSDDLIQAGFRLVNPNATSSCGCGASFAS